MVVKPTPEPTPQPTVRVTSPEVIGNQTNQPMSYLQFYSTI